MNGSLEANRVMYGSTWGYMGVQESKTGAGRYMGIRENTREYRRDTRTYRGVTWEYKGTHGSTRGYTGV